MTADLNERSQEETEALELEALWKHNTRSPSGQPLCSICFGQIDEQPHWVFGHNAEPINPGRCCTACNDRCVIPARITLALATSR